MIVASTFGALISLILLTVALIVLLSVPRVVGRRWLIVVLVMHLLSYGLIVSASSDKLLTFLLRHGSMLNGLVWIVTWSALIMYIRSRPIAEHSDQ